MTRHLDKERSVYFRCTNCGRNEDDVIQNQDFNSNDFNIFMINNVWSSSYGLLYAIYSVVSDTLLCYDNKQNGKPVFRSSNYQDGKQCYV